jgi:hypothetical protein
MRRLVPSRAVRRLVDPVRRVLWFVRLGRQRPAVTVRLHRWVPGWAIRVCCVLVAAGCVLLTEAPSPLTWIVSVLAVLLLGWPSGMLPAVVAVLIGLCTLYLDPTATDIRPFMILAGVHLQVQLAALIGRTGWRARIELGVLVAALRRYLPIQAVAQAVALLGLTLTRQRLEVAWLPVLGVVSLTLVVIWLVAQLRAGVDKLKDPTA